MRKICLAMLCLLSAAPEVANAQYVDGALVIYGNDRCPTNKDGQEIVVCARRPENERYRIPKELRPGGKFAESESWTKRSSSTLSVGNTGAGSCSAVGPGGFTGCFQQEADAYRSAKKADKAADKAAP